MSQQVGSALLMVRTDVKEEGEEAFNDWYTNVHLPEIVEVPGIHWGRRYRLSGSELYPAAEGELAYLAIYELENTAVLDGTKFAEAKGWSPEVQDFPVGTKVSVHELIAAQEEK